MTRKMDYEKSKISFSDRIISLGNSCKINREVSSKPATEVTETLEFHVTLGFLTITKQVFVPFKVSFQS